MEESTAETAPPPGLDAAADHAPGAAGLVPSLEGELRGVLRDEQQRPLVPARRGLTFNRSRSGAGVRPSRTVKLWENALQTNQAAQEQSIVSASLA